MIITLLAEHACYYIQYNVDLPFLQHRPTIILHKSVCRGNRVTRASVQLNEPATGHGSSPATRRSDDNRNGDNCGHG